jgi:hypothetical protein
MCKVMLRCEYFHLAVQVQKILWTSLSAILIRKRTVSQLVKKFLAFYVTPKLLTVFSTTFYYPQSETSSPCCHVLLTIHINIILRYISRYPSSIIVGIQNKNCAWFGIMYYSHIPLRKHLKVILKTPQELLQLYKYWMMVCHGW